MSPKYSPEFEVKIRPVVNARTPLGPFDTAQIIDDEVAALLFDRRIEVIQSAYDRGAYLLVGRRGSGKSAALKAWIRKDPVHLDEPWRAAPSQPTFTYAVQLQAFDEFPRIQRALEAVAGPNQATFHVEQSANSWTSLFWFYLGREILDHADAFARNSPHYISLMGILGDDASRAAKGSDLIHDLIVGNADKSVLARARSFVAPVWEQVRDAVTRFLYQQECRAVVTLDSMEEYELSKPIVRAAVNGLLRCGALLDSTEQPARFLLSLPSEIFARAIVPALSNPVKDLQRIEDKDFNSADSLDWTARDLLEMAAFRYRLFLELNDQPTFLRVALLDLHRELDLLEFWHHFFPRKIRNKFGGEESSLNYLLRHTQLLPRQIIVMFNSVVTRCHSVTKGWSAFPEAQIVEAVTAAEDRLAQEVFSAYQDVYPHPVAFQVCERALRGARPLLKYEELQRRWYEDARPLLAPLGMSEFRQFLDMVIEIGVVGRPVSMADRCGTTLIHAAFAYENRESVAFDEGDTLCIHPIFFRSFGVHGDLESGIVSPQGSIIEELP